MEEKRREKGMWGGTNNSLYLIEKIHPNRGLDSERLKKGGEK